jgi:hypothetical protein
MSSFEFIGPQAVVYVERALEVSPGDVVDWPDGAPDDGNWRSVTTKKSRHSSSVATSEAESQPESEPVVPSQGDPNTQE